MSRQISWKDLILWRLHKVCNDPLEVSQVFLGYICSNPREKNKCTVFIGNIFRVYIILISFLSVFNLFLTTDIWELASTIEGIMVCLQVK